MSDVVDEAHCVVHVGGTYLERDLFVLVICSEEHALS